MLEGQIRLCLLGKEVGVADAIARALDSGFETRYRSDLDLSRWSDWREWCNVVLVDISKGSTSSDVSALAKLMEDIAESPSRPPVIVFCDEKSSEFVPQVVENGAYEVISEGLSIVKLRQVIRRAHKIRSAERELESLRSTARSSGRMHQLIGASPAMQELFALAQKIALCDVNVLITGETGTGKELLASAIHQMSARKSQPMVVFSCTNMPDTLIEDELFGHEKGAFTGALMGRRGRVEMADKGTLFLDEIGDLGLGLQPKLLRVLQERSFERLGGNTTVNVNVRLIAATNRNLTEMVERREFREDLYYRLNVVQLHLAPLRERQLDIALLAQHFLQEAAQRFDKKVRKFSHSTLQAMEEYLWPGNVRELENTVQRAVVLCDGHTIEPRHLPLAIGNASEVIALNGSYEQEIRRFKRRLVVRTLRQCHWSKAETARTLGIARGYLHRLISQLDIRESEEPEALTAPQPISPPRMAMPGYEDPTEQVGVVEKRRVL
jgi:DNA-binding NtrC family response regulator